VIPTAEVGREVTGGLIELAVSCIAEKMTHREAAIADTVVTIIGPAGCSAVTANMAK
jgi:hypothetical protein